MFLELDGRGPLHAQLTRAMRTAILDGRLRGGSRLPPTRELAAELGLSRTTVLTAYEQLRAEGFIAARTGSGSYVNVLEGTCEAPPPAADLPPPTRYVQRLRASRGERIVPWHAEIRYDLQYGEPLINPALTTAWARELARAARYTDPRYPGSQGVSELREAIRDYLARRRGVQVDASRVVVVNGTQQALSLVARVLLDEGDRAAIEEPRYFGAYQVFTAHGADLQPLRTDLDGLVCEELPSEPPRLVFTTPSHQFPSGVVMSLQRRLELLRYAQQTGCWIVEDDYDSEFRYDMHPIAALRALDEHDRVIYIGTFSKAMIGSLRLGYMIVPEALREDFVRAKWLDDMGSSAIEQMAMASFMRNGGFERHLRHASKMLKSRRAALLKGLREHAGDRVHVDDSHAGMHLVAWLTDLDHGQCGQLIRNALAKGLGLYPISTHYFQLPPKPGLLMGYAGLSVPAIESAMAVFGECLAAIPASTSG